MHAHYSHHRPYAQKFEPIPVVRYAQILRRERHDRRVHNTLLPLITVHVHYKIFIKNVLIFASFINSVTSVDYFRITSLLTIIS